MGLRVLETEKVCKTFGEGELKTTVLNDVNIAVDEGEFVAIVGESGSGKSTLLYIMAGIDKPTSGRVTLLGRDLSAITDEDMAAMRRREISFVYQFDNLVPNLTAYENIVLPLQLDKKKESDYKDRVASVCDYLGIADRIRNAPSTLSGGEQQRVALARALATEPKLIFLDEPTGSLDKERGRQVMELLKDINEREKVAMVLVTHSAAHAAYANRIIHIDDGRILQ